MIIQYISGNGFILKGRLKKNFLLLSLDWYLLRVVSGNTYLSKDSNVNTFSYTTTGNHIIFDFVMLH